MTAATRVVIAAWLATIGSLLVAGFAAAAFPGTNGKIAYSLDESPAASSDIYTIDPSGQNRTRLTSGADDDGDPSWSGDGELIAFTRESSAPPMLGQIWLMSHDGTGQSQVTGPAAPNSDSEPAISPDGNRIAFTRFDGGSQQIFIVNANGTGSTQLTFPPGTGVAPAFSPDGTRIAFARTSPTTGFTGISTMNLDGSDVRTVTPGSATISDDDPDWSPDGQRIVFERGGGGDDEIFTVNVDGSSLNQVTDPTSGDDYEPVYSPDGARVAYFNESSTGPVTQEIFTADPTGLNQNVTQVTTGGADVLSRDPSWQPLNASSCDLGGKIQKSVKRIRVTVSCAENATVVAQGSGKAPQVPKLALASKAKKFKIPAVTAQVNAGAPTTVTLKVPKKGAKALKRAAKAGKNGKATISVTLTDDLGQSVTETLRVKFKKKK